MLGDWSMKGLGDWRDKRSGDWGRDEGGLEEGGREAAGQAGARGGRRARATGGLEEEEIGRGLGRRHSGGDWAQKLGFPPFNCPFIPAR
jgi:hypothetical protein